MKDSSEGEIVPAEGIPKTFKKQKSETKTAVARKMGCKTKLCKQSHPAARRAADSPQSTSERELAIATALDWKVGGLASALRCCRPTQNVMKNRFFTSALFSIFL